MSNKDKENGNREGPHMKIKWKSDFDKDVIIDNFKNRKWQEVEDEDGLPEDKFI